MPEGTSVGVISLDLVIKEQLSKQLDGIKSRVQSAVSKPFEEAEQSIERTLGKTSESAKKATENAARTVIRVNAHVKEEVNKIAQESRNALEEAVKPRASMKYEVYDSEAIMADIDKYVEALKKPKEQAEQMTQAMREAFGNYDVPTDKVERLNLEIEQTREKIGLVQARWQELQASLASAQTDGEAAKIVEQLNSVERQITGLYGTIESRQAQVDKLVKNGADEQKRSADKTSKAHTAASNNIKRVYKNAFNSLKNAGGKALDGIKSKLSGVGKSASSLTAPVTKFANSLKSAAKRVFIMAGAYAALRGIKSAIEEAAKSNDEFARSLNEVKANLNIAFQPVIDAAMPAINTLMAGLAAATKQIAAFTSELFGSTYQKSLETVRKIKEVGKEAQKSSTYLASFDEMNVVQDTSSSSSESVDSSGIDYSAISPEVKLGDWAQQLKDAIRSGDWNGAGKLLAEKVNSVFNGINWDYIKKKVKNGASAIADAMNGFTDNLDWRKLGDTAAEGLNTALLGLDTVLVEYHWETLGSGIADLLNGAIDTTDWALVGKTLGDQVNAAINTAYGFVTTFEWKGFGGGLAESVNSWFATTDFSKAAQTLSGALTGVLDTAIAFLGETDWQQVGEKITDFIVNIDYTGLAERIFKLCGSVIGAVAALIVGAVKDIDIITPIIEHFRSCIAKFDTGSVGGDIVLGILNGIITAYRGIYQWIYDHMFKPFIDGFKDAFGISSPSKVMKQMAGFIMSGLFDGIKDKISELKSKATEIKDHFLKPIKQIPTYINGIFRADFSKAWSGIRQVLKSAWDLMVGVVKSPVNSIIDLINGMTSAVAGGFNKVLGSIESTVNSVADAVSSLSFDVPEAVADIVGFDSIGFSMPHISIPTVDIPEIPHLAMGGLATAPTLAMVGDNPGASSDPEAILPISRLTELLDGGKLAEAVELLKEIAELIRSLDLELTAKVDDKVLFTIVQRLAQEYKRRTGRSAFDG